MTSIGVTGHQRLPEPVLAHVRFGIREVLSGLAAPIDGYSSLAEGADQLFAQELLAVGGFLHAVIPSAGYEATLTGDADVSFMTLLSRAMSVVELPYGEPCEVAFDEAGKWIADHSEIMIAVWDGRESRGLGGTADAVRYARALGRDVRIVWPEGVDRP